MRSLCVKTMAVVVSLLLAIIGIVVIGCGKSVPKKAAAQSTYEQPQTGRSVPEQPERALPPINAANPNRVVIANGEWDPYFSENLQHYGVVSRIVTEAFAIEGIEVEYVFRPWKRGMEEAKNGKWNGTMGWGKKPDRLEVFNYCDEPIMETISTLFHRKDYPLNWDTLSDLKGLDISGTAGYFYGDAIEAAEKNGEVDISRGPADKLNFKKLSEGRTTVVINDLDVGYALMRTELSPEQASQITHHPTEVGSFPCYLLLAKDNAENKRLLELFNKGLKKLQQSGKVKQYWQESRRGDYVIKCR
ncbi:MAG TPA: transporter substrate-binding domain-containing protein [Phycisphaerales bacterium]|nr:transporter substrate-binding domain-containing protein [Phycisphaerales bacterium]